MSPKSGAAKAREAKNEKRWADRSSVIATQLEGFSAQYAEVLDSWKMLDAKAQTASATAGVFLAGAFAVLRATAASLDGVEKWIISFALGALFLSVCFGIRSLELRSTLSPPRGTAFADRYRDLYQTEEFDKGGAEFQARWSAFRRDQVNVWNEAVRQQLIQLESKARWTRNAQRLLALGVLAFSLLTLTQVWK